MLRVLSLLLSMIISNSLLAKVQMDHCTLLTGNIFLHQKRKSMRLELSYKAHPENENLNAVTGFLTLSGEKFKLEGKADNWEVDLTEEKHTEPTLKIAINMTYIPNHNPSDPLRYTGVLYFENENKATEQEFKLRCK